MTLLLCSFVVVYRKKNKKRRKLRARRKRQGCSLNPGLGIAERAQQRHLKKEHEKTTTQNKEAINDKRRHKNLTIPVRDHTHKKKNTPRGVSLSRRFATTALPPYYTGTQVLPFP
jgi:hypothetical protein